VRGTGRVRGRGFGKPVNRVPVNRVPEPRSRPRPRTSPDPDRLDARVRIIEHVDERSTDELAIECPALDLKHALNIEQILGPEEEKLEHGEDFSRVYVRDPSGDRRRSATCLGFRVEGNTRNEDIDPDGASHTGEHSAGVRLGFGRLALNGHACRADQRDGPLEGIRLDPQDDVHVGGSARFRPCGKRDGASKGVRLTAGFEYVDQPKYDTRYRLICHARGS
jgi:hypothetical protein